MARNKRRPLGVRKCRRFRTFMIKKEGIDGNQSTQVTTSAPATLFSGDQRRC